MNKFKKQLTAFVILTTILVVAQVVVCIQISSIGTQTYLLEKEYKSLSDENIKKSAQLMKYSSLTKLDEDSSGYGFIKPSAIVYLGRDNGEVAQLR